MRSYQIFGIIQLLFNFAVIGFAIYGLICAMKNISLNAKKMVLRYEKQISTERKKNMLNAVKLLFGAQVIGLLFYITPVINENIKIILSLITTLGAFVAVALIEEKKGINGAYRALVFIGQEFFGITMLLLMVNKGMGYSVNVIFLLWTIFNFYIFRKVGKIENKAFFWVTLSIFVISLLGTYVDDVNLMFAIIVTCIALLSIHFIGNPENKGICIADNICFTLLILLTLGAFNDSETSYLGSFITIIFTIGLIGVGVVRAYLNQEDGKNINLRALLLYIPFIVILMVSTLEDDLFLLLGIFNLAVSMLLVSRNSIYKKVLAGLILATIGFAAMENVNVDELIFAIIYFSSVIFGYAYLWVPEKVEVLEEGDEEDDEE